MTGETVPKALGGAGIFTVRNHGVDDYGACAGALAAARRCFRDLGAAGRDAISHVRSPAYRGYISMAAENTQGVPDEREQIEFGPEPPPEQHSGSLPGRAAADRDRAAPLYTRLVGPNLWPSERRVPGFRAALEAFVRACAALCARLSRLLSRALGLPGTAFDHYFFEGAARAEAAPSGGGEGGGGGGRGAMSNFADLSRVSCTAPPGGGEASGAEGPHWQCKIARYPLPTAPDPTGGAPSGCGEHTDSGWLSVLLQDAPGLQVVDRRLLSNGGGGGGWVAAPPRDGCLVVVLGEMLALASGGAFRATPHRVANAFVPGATERVSVPFFWNPRLSAVVAEHPALRARRQGGGGAAAAEHRAGGEAGSPGGAGGNARNRIIGAYGNNALKSLARSHPAVTKRWHGDLVVLRDGTVRRRAPGRL